MSVIISFQKVKWDNIINIKYYFNVLSVLIRLRHLHPPSLSEGRSLTRYVDGLPLIPPPPPGLGSDTSDTCIHCIQPARALPLHTQQRTLNFRGICMFVFVLHPAYGLISSKPHHCDFAKIVEKMLHPLSSSVYDYYYFYIIISVLSLQCLDLHYCTEAKICPKHRTCLKSNFHLILVPKVSAIPFVLFSFAIIEISQKVSI